MCSAAVHSAPPAAGAGKTTLLNSLAGQLPRNAALQLSGAISVNGVSVEASQHRQGYVQQEDIFFSQLTVKCAAPLPPALEALSPAPLPSRSGSDCEALPTSLRCVSED